MHGLREARQGLMVDLLTERQGLPNGFRMAYDLYQLGDSLEVHAKKCRKWFQEWKATQPGRPDQIEQVLKAMLSAVHEIHVKEVRALVLDRGRAL
jgi:hypothetical protein